MGMDIDFASDLNIPSSGTARDPAFLCKAGWTYAKVRWQRRPHAFQERGKKLIEKAGDEDGDITKSK